MPLSNAIMPIPDKPMRTVHVIIRRASGMIEKKPVAINLFQEGDVVIAMLHPGDQVMGLEQ